MHSVLKISLVTDETVSKQIVSLVRNSDKVLSPEVSGSYLHSSFRIQEFLPMTHVSRTHKTANKRHKVSH